jgi:aminopeptidase-like protein
MFDLIKRLFPIPRSITGNGVRESLSIIKEYFPIQIREVKTGTKVFDWTVPKEWNIQDAYLKNSKGEKIVDFKKSNLHVLGYSIPVHKKMRLDELKPHLFTSPKYPDCIPYLHSYYKENWGFCLTQKQFDTLEDDIYEVVIDSTLSDGSLTYGEYYLKGELEDEVLITSYICHPSLCNDNLSGVVLLTFLANYLKDKKLRYSYRFLLIPETIGSITWLSLNEEKIKNIKYGLVVTCIGDPGISTYKKSRQGNALIDKIAEKALIDSKEPYEIIDFFPMGSDERQFCSPGFNLPVGSLMRTPYWKFPEYHSSADNLDFISGEKMANSLKKYLEILYIIENNATYLNLNPKCEPQLGSKGLYRSIATERKCEVDEYIMLWVLNYSDGFHSLLDISVLAKAKFVKIKKAAELLLSHGLLKRINS